VAVTPAETKLMLAMSKLRDGYSCPDRETVANAIQALYEFLVPTKSDQTKSDQYTDIALDFVESPGDIPPADGSPMRRAWDLGRKASGLRTALDMANDELTAAMRRISSDTEKTEVMRQRAEKAEHELRDAREWQTKYLKRLEGVQVDYDELLAAAKHAIPEDEHPAEKTAHNWAWQIRVLGDDRRAAYRQRATARDEAKRLEMERDAARANAAENSIRATKAESALKNYIDTQGGKTQRQWDAILRERDSAIRGRRDTEAQWRDGIERHAKESVWWMEQLETVRSDNASLREKLDRATKALDRDATGMADALNRIRKVITSRMWLLEGRGAYDWNDDRYKEEAGIAMRAALEIIGESLNASGTLAGQAFIEARAVQTTPSPLCLKCGHVMQPGHVCK
jgi:hypothetical protein